MLQRHHLRGFIVFNVIFAMSCSMAESLNSSLHRFGTASVFNHLGWRMSRKRWKNITSVVIHHDVCVWISLLFWAYGEVIGCNEIPPYSMNESTSSPHLHLITAIIFHHAPIFTCIVVDILFYSQVNWTGEIGRLSHLYRNKSLWPWDLASKWCSNLCSYSETDRQTRA